MGRAGTPTPSQSAPRASTPTRVLTASPFPSSAAGRSLISDCKERVQVVVRCRPLSEREIAAGHKSCVLIDKERNTVQVHNASGRFSSEFASKIFTFDRAYDESCTQRQLYRDVAYSIVHSVMCGYNGTVLAYGQTASGKTYTMEGCDYCPDLWGIIPNAFEHIFNHIRQSQSSDSFLVRVSYLEIYNEEIHDLLSPDTNGRKLELKERPETGVYVKNLTSLSVNSFADINHLLMVGKRNRAVGATIMNQDSSRSHSIFTVTVETSSLAPQGNGKMHVRVGKLNLVDLAGSERLAKSGATGERFKEMTKINWSLSALANVISALVDGKATHIPYRDSKLTRLLQDSLGGNTCTVMIANIGPADYNYEESVSTLRYAHRAKSIRNKPQVNEDPKDAIISEFQSEIQRLKAQIQASQPEIDVMRRLESLEQEKLMVTEQLQQYKEKVLEATTNQRMSEQAIACLKADLEGKAQIQLECLKAEKERSEEEKEKIITQLLKQLREMEHQNQELSRGKEDRALLESKLKVLEEKLIRGTNSGGKNVTEQVKQRSQDLASFGHAFEEQKLFNEECQQKMIEMERFIPPEEVAKIMQKMRWDDDSEVWIFRSSHSYSRNSTDNVPIQRPASAVGRSRPTCQKALQFLAQGTTNPRYLDENVLKLELESPERVTFDYCDPIDRIRAESQIHQCLKDLDNGNAYFSYDSRPSPLPQYRSSPSRPKSAHVSQHARI
ncbi:hypothetical protein KP509_34G066800 [Ceratopteris richardii]|uniref:Kinesin-like protein n=1 Tax=Ceratopteris richardii TaxID=49495 RepID=A0A8T2QM68_CERRI|nr:hypothetical protein KP509_34G066800 [Ceratopteris richardii]